MTAEVGPMQLREMPLDSLSPDPRNARTHDDRNLDAIKRSLAAFGQQKPIVVDRHGVIRAGNGTYAAARQMGWTSLQAVVTDLPADRAAAYAIADNRTAELAEWDQPRLAELLAELRQNQQLDLNATGFSEQELDALIDAVADMDDPGLDVPALHQVLAECDDEAQQQRVYAMLNEAGVKCRVLTL